jgi:hypothetical protein
MKTPDEEDMPVTDERTNQQKRVTTYAPTTADPTTEARPHSIQDSGGGQYTQDTAHAANNKHNQQKHEGPEAPPTTTPRDRIAPTNGYPTPWDSDQDTVNQLTPGKELQQYASSRTRSLGQTPKNQQYENTSQEANVADRLPYQMMLRQVADTIHNNNDRKQEALKRLNEFSLNPPEAQHFLSSAVNILYALEDSQLSIEEAVYLQLSYDPSPHTQADYTDADVADGNHVLEPIKKSPTDYNQVPEPIKKSPETDEKSEGPADQDLTSTVEMPNPGVSAPELGPRQHSRAATDVNRGDQLLTELDDLMTCPDNPEDFINHAVKLIYGLEECGTTIKEAALFSSLRGFYTFAHQSKQAKHFTTNTQARSLTARRMKVLTRPLESHQDI